MRALKFTVTVEGLPEHAKDYRIQGDVCAGATEVLRRGYPDGKVNVIVVPARAALSGAQLGEQVSYLAFDPSDGSGGRWQRGDYGLHCGNCFEVRTNGAWHLTRIEHSSFSKHSHGWYLVDFPNLELEGLAVRKAT